MFIKDRRDLMGDRIANSSAGKIGSFILRDDVIPLIGIAFLAATSEICHHPKFATTLVTDLLFGSALSIAARFKDRKRLEKFFSSESIKTMTIDINPGTILEAPTNRYAFRANIMSEKYVSDKLLTSTAVVVGNIISCGLGVAVSRGVTSALAFLPLLAREINGQRRWRHIASGTWQLKPKGPTPR